MPDRWCHIVTAGGVLACRVHGEFSFNGETFALVKTNDGYSVTHVGSGAALPIGPITVEWQRQAIELLVSTAGSFPAGLERAMQTIQRHGLYVHPEIWEGDMQIRTKRTVLILEDQPNG